MKVILRKGIAHDLVFGYTDLDHIHDKSSCHDGHLVLKIGFQVPLPPS